MDPFILPVLMPTLQSHLGPSTLLVADVHSRGHVLSHQDDTETSQELDSGQ